MCPVEIGATSQTHCLHCGQEIFEPITEEDHESEGLQTMVGTGGLEPPTPCGRGACMNVCPVYRTVGGHSYGWTYPGPMGIVLTTLLTGMAKSHPLVDASTRGWDLAIPVKSVVRTIPMGPGYVHPYECPPTVR